MRTIRLALMSGSEKVMDRLSGLSTPNTRADPSSASCRGTRAAALTTPTQRARYLERRTDAHAGSSVANNNNNR